MKTYLLNFVKENRAPALTRIQATWQPLWYKEY